MRTCWAASRPARTVKGGSNYNRPALAQCHESLVEQPTYAGDLFGIRLVRRVS